MNIYAPTLLFQLEMAINCADGENAIPQTPGHSLSDGCHLLITEPERTQRMSTGSRESFDHTATTALLGHHSTPPTLVMPKQEMIWKRKREKSHYY